MAVWFSGDDYFRSGVDECMWGRLRKWRARRPDSGSPFSCRYQRDARYAFLFWRPEPWRFLELDIDILIRSCHIKRYRFHINA